VQLIDRKDLRSPSTVIDVDLASDSADEKLDLTDVSTAWCLVRRSGTAVAARFLDVRDEGQITSSALRDWLITNDDVPEAVSPPQKTSGTVTVAICTRDRQDRLARMLESLARQSDTEFDVLIIDNSSDGNLAREGIEIEGLRVRVCHEPMPGLSRARNRAVSEARSDYLAWLDDDEVADTDWMAWIKRGFASECQPVAVVGVMLPAELETQAQINFERYGGFNKGRGMQPEVLRAGTSAVADPLLPLPNFGAGGNMAFRTDALRSIGGFDNRLGTGTLTCGGDETRALSLILDTCGVILHWPPAVTWHYHRRTDDELERQFFGYAAGLPAYYMSLLATSPRYFFRLIRLVPQIAKAYLAQRDPGNPDRPPPDFPESLLRASRRGLAQGAWLYAREVVRQRRKDGRAGIRLNSA
jgi:glycosyltransferase involved in cell wall biosynthesis